MKINKDEIWVKAMELCSPTCHQKASRSFVIKGYQLPVCARCTGMFLGYIIGLILSVMNAISILIGIILIIPCFIDGFIQYRYNYESTNSRRFLTGFLAGIGYLIVIIGIIRFFIK